jgi:diacylglycerol kinase (ATP)
MMSFFNPRRRLLSFKYAAQGFKWAFATQANLWIHLIAAIAVVVSGFYFDIQPLEWVILVACIAGVFALEMINTCIEWLVDSIYKEQHAVAGKIKDVAAAAVLVGAMGAAVIGTIVLYPYVDKAFF